jgi:hypothetical protein
MVQNTAFLALLTVFLLVGWLAGEVRFLAPYKAGLFRLHGPLILGAILLVFLNLCAVYYALARWLFLRDAGRKLSHLDRQLTMRDTALEDLGQHLEENRPDVA